MRSHAKVVTLLLLLGATLSTGEEAKATTTVGEEVKETGPKDATPKDEEGSTKSPEKRGLFRLTGVHGENPQQYQVVYSVPQQTAGYQQPSVAQQYEPRAAAGSPSPKYEQAFVRPYAYSAQASFQQPIFQQPTFQQHSFQQPYAIPSPSPSYHTPYPYSTATTMILLMTPPHPGNPYGSLMLVPANNIVPQYSPNNIVPQYSPNHILPFQGAGRVPIQFVPQYVPVPVKGFGQSPGFPAAHFKGSEYSQKPQVQQYQSYQDPNPTSYPVSSEEQDQSTPTPNYGGRVRPSEQYKG